MVGGHRTRTSALLNHPSFGGILEFLLLLFSLYLHADIDEVPIKKCETNSLCVCLI